MFAPSSRTPSVAKLTAAHCSVKSESAVVPCEDQPGELIFDVQLTPGDSSVPSHDLLLALPSPEEKESRRLRGLILAAAVVTTILTTLAGLWAVRRAVRRLTEFLGRFVV